MSSKDNDSGLSFFWVVVIMLIVFSYPSDKKALEPPPSTDPVWVGMMVFECPAHSTPLMLERIEPCLGALCFKVIGRQEGQETVMVLSPRQKKFVSIDSLRVAMREGLTLCVKPDPEDDAAQLIVATVRNAEKGENP